MTSDLHIDATNAVGADYEAGRITRDEARERLRRLGHEDAEIDDMLDVVEVVEPA